MIVGAAFVPATPLLVPEVAQGAAPELHDLRTACRTAIKRVCAGAERIVILGEGPQRRVFSASTRGTLAGFGVPFEVSLGRDGDGPLELPPALTVGAWLVRDALGPNSGATGISVVDHRTPQLPDRCALVVVGDGSARRSISAPGYFDERAEAFDAAVAHALGRGRGWMLGESYIDVHLGPQLLVSGIAAWAAAGLELEVWDFDAELLYNAAPYGVGYFVAAWTLGA